MARRKRKKEEITFGTFIVIVLVATAFFIVLEKIQNFYHDHPVSFWLIFSLIIAAIIYGVVVYTKRRFFTKGQ
jgi:divalent metal cation (Fe/Co/Zn/Cd) transporter